MECNTKCLNFGVTNLYCGPSGEQGFYNSQEVGLCRAMKEIGYKCYVFRPSIMHKELTEELIEDRISIIHCPAKKIGVHSKYDWNILKKYDVSVIQVVSDNQLFVPSLIKYCDRNKIHVYNYIGAVGTDSTNQFKLGVMNVLFKRNLSIYRKHKVFAKTRSVKQSLEQMGVLDIELAPVGLDTAIIPSIKESKEEIRSVCNLPLEKRILLYVGRMDTYKKPQDMLELLDNLQDEYYGVLIGDGKLSGEIERIIEGRKLEKRLVWIKKIKNNEVQKYYVAADYYLNFNDHEIFGMSILEAMYHGCTVLVRHAPGPDMIIEDKVSGFLFDEIDEVKLILDRKIQLNPSVIRKRITDEFTWHKSAKIFNEWIRTVCD